MYDEQGNRISSTRISKGIIDRHGKVIESSNNFGVIVDIHYGISNEESKNKEIKDSVRETMKNSKCDTWFVLGDLIHEKDSTSEDLDKDRFSEMWDIIEQNSENCYFVPGNNDVINLSKDYMCDVVGHDLPCSVELEGTTFYLLDSATCSEIDNIGRLSEESIDLVKDIEEDSYIISHFLHEYTEAYQESEYFSSYPEAVFSINSFYLEQALDYSKIRRQIFGHLHVAHSYFSNGASCDIVEPFINIIDIENQEFEINSSCKYYSF